MPLARSRASSEPCPSAVFTQRMVCPVTVGGRMRGAGRDPLPAKLRRAEVERLHRPAADRRAACRRPRSGRPATASPRRAGRPASIRLPVAGSSDEDAFGEVDGDRLAVVLRDGGPELARGERRAARLVDPGQRDGRDLADRRGAQPPDDGVAVAEPEAVAAEDRPVGEARLAIGRARRRAGVPAAQPLAFQADPLDRPARRRRDDRLADQDRRADVARPAERPESLAVLLALRRSASPPRPRRARDPRPAAGRSGAPRPARPTTRPRTPWRCSRTA